MSPEVDSFLARLRPYPHNESRADAPVAVDATDRLLLDEATALIARDPGDVVIIGDRFGALTLGALALGAHHVRVHQDAITAEAALNANAADVFDFLRYEPPSVGAQPRNTLRQPQPLWTGYDELSADALTGARLVLLQLPMSLAELTEIAELIAQYADPAMTLLAGGRVKHMTHAMNHVLDASFGQVSTSLARQKSRLLIARQPRGGKVALTYPVTARLDDPEIHSALTTPSLAAAELGVADLTVIAHGGAFAGATLDLGTRFLLAQAARWPDLSSAARNMLTSGVEQNANTPPVAVDLGCGTGILATVLARRYPSADVIATDRSAKACASARATFAANHVKVTVDRSDAGDVLPDNSADLVLLNPPFHDRSILSTDAAHRMFATAGRVLRHGGELWTVFNTRLHYHRALERAVGPTQHVAQNTKFTVTRTLRDRF